MPILILPDGSRRTVKEARTISEAVQTAAPELRETVVAARVNGAAVDLSASLPSDAEVLPVTKDSQEGRDILRHSLAHIMADAVSRLFPGVLLAIGPSIEDGFYYDFDLEHKFTRED